MSDTRKTLLYIDCFSGIAGDMMLGALLDLGVPEAHLRTQLDKLGLAGWRLESSRVRRRGIGGIDVQVRYEDQTHARTWNEIRALILAAGLEPRTEELALTIFAKLAEAEGRIHGVAPEDVHFHEVGAIDSIVDVCGSAIGLAWLDLDEIVCAPVPAPRGFVRCAHGKMPVPAPATLELLRGAELQEVEARGEWVTPTGAAILATCVERFGPIPAMRVERIGYGAGDRDFAEHPNLLRLVLGTVPRAASAASHDLLLEANIDDMSPELFGHLSDRLFATGVHDVWLTPIQMKKGRPATKLSVLCDSAHRTEVVSVILRESTTIGLRQSRVERYKTAHRLETCQTSLGPVRVKVARDGDEVVNQAPEYEDVRRIAVETGLPLKEVMRKVSGEITTCCSAACRDRPSAKPA